MTPRHFAYAGRTLRKSPAFTITAILTIALGVGTSTAIFSVTNAVLLRPLPYKDPDRLAIACMDMRKRAAKDLPLPVEDYFDIKNATTGAFQDMAAVTSGRNVLEREDGSPEQVSVAAVTTNFFRMMGLEIAAGRDFNDADGQPQPQPAPGSAPPPGTTPGPALQRLPNYAILSYEFWQRRYGGSTAVLGRRLANRGTAGPEIVGVLAPGAELFFPPSMNIQRTPDFWLAARLRYDNANRNQFSQRVIGRLKPGASIEQAQAQTDSVSAQLRRTFPIKETSGFYVRFEPMHNYLVAEVKPAILALMGAVIFLLLIACANVANLLLVRAASRERELAVRTALGGSAWNMVGQILAECLLLAGAGTVLGLLIARFGIDALLFLAPVHLPRLDTITMDPSVVVFSALAGLAAAALFGIAPALRAIRPDVIQVLRASGRTGGLASAGMLRNSVVVAEVALSFVLLIGSGLMFRSFLALLQVNPGFDPHGMLTFQLLGGRNGRTPEERAARTREIFTRLRAIPGVESVAAADPFPLTGRFSPIRWGTEEALSDASRFQAVDNQIVLPGYLEAMRTPLLAGRTFTGADNAPDRKVVIVDEALAAKAYPGESVIGKRILIRLRTPEPEWVEIIGVTAHQRTTSLAEPGREQVFFLDGFVGHGAIGRWALRTSGDPNRLQDAVRSEMARIDPGILIAEMKPMEALVGQARAGTRFSLLLIGAFAGIAVLLAGVGLYGVLATVVRQRTAEIGVRMALGAQPSSIFGLVVGHGLRLSAAGIAAGFGAALILTRLMTSMLVGVKPTDPLTFVVMAALFLFITALASWLPARRASGVDPSIALREE